MFPDVEIYPTIDDILEERDPVFDWIVEDIRRHAHSERLPKGRESD
jgi:hypothetical protein